MADFPFSNFASANDIVGEFRFSPDIGPKITMGSREYLRTGVVISSTGYAGAAAIDYLKATGTAATQATSIGSTYTDIATDGNGRWVVAYGSSSSLLYSTDNGATWATVTHNAGGGVGIYSVCYSSALNLFICAGNNSTTFYTSTQTPASVGSAWVVRTGSAIGSGSSDATTLVRASANEVVMVAGNNGTTGCASRSTNGTSWTAANFASGIGNNNLPLEHLSYLGSNIWIAQGSNTMQRSTDGGASWATVASGSTASIVAAAFGAGLLINFDSSGSLYTSANGATGTFTNRGNPFGVFTARQVMFDGTRFIASLSAASTTAAFKSAYAYSTDGLTWSIRGFTGKVWADSVATRIHSDGDDMVFIPYLTSSTGAVYGQFSDTSKIGIPYLVTSSSNGNMFVTDIQYVRIK